jgi:3-deoxy-manno-octulosonate cytidylyltransferase (CMP-KDO synthetase)
MIVAVIPARYRSRRFPGKPLAPVSGIPLVAHVARRVVESAVAERVIVATDDPRIAEAVARSGCAVELHLSSEPFASGSDRVAEAVSRLEGAEVVINVQGDEALVDAAMLRAAIAALESGPSEIGTVAAPVEDPSLLDDPNAVKVAIDGEGRALAFARRLEGLGTAGAGGGVLHHGGVYAFTRASLVRFAALPPSRAEVEEGLEQLRALEAGMRIGVARIERPLASVNTPEDLARACALLGAAAGGGRANHGSTRPGHEDRGG